MHGVSVVTRILDRRVRSLALARMPLPTWARRGLRAGLRLVTSYRRVANTSLRRTNLAGTLVLTLAVSFGFGYAVSAWTKPSSTSQAAHPVGRASPVGSATTTATSPTEPCPTVPSGDVAAYLEPVTTGSGTSADPRTTLATPWVGIDLRSVITPTAGKPPFAVTAVLLPDPSIRAVGAGALDRAGTLQLAVVWDGVALHKRVRRWDGHTWRLADESDPSTANLTIALGGTEATLYWPELTSGERFGFVTSDDHGCRAIGLDSALTPTILAKP